MRGMRQRPKVYLAGPLFSDAELTFNESLAFELEKLVDVYLPQRDGGIMSEMIKDGVHPRWHHSVCFILIWKLYAMLTI